jgi:hypothetical protein
LTSFIADQADLASAAQMDRQRHLGPGIAHDVCRSRILDPLRILGRFDESASSRHFGAEIRFLRDGRRPAFRYDLWYPRLRRWEIMSDSDPTLRSR